MLALLLPILRKINRKTRKKIEKLFYVFERSILCLPRLHLFDEKYSKNKKSSNIVK